MTEIIFFFSGVPEVVPRIIVVGALGRCGRGAVEMAGKMGIPKYASALCYNRPFPSGPTFASFSK